MTFALTASSKFIISSKTAAVRDHSGIIVKGASRARCHPPPVPGGPGAVATAEEEAAPPIVGVAPPAGGPVSLELVWDDATSCVAVVVE